MEYVFIVIVLALLQYLAFGIMVGRARSKYNIEAPATSGDPVFERYFRVQQNTGEQLIMFLPAILLYGYMNDPLVAAGLGVIYLIGRLLYLRSYVADPGSRSLGFALSVFPILFMLIASLTFAVTNLL